MTADAITHLRAELESLRSLVAQQATRIEELERRGSVRSAGVVSSQPTTRRTGEAISPVPAALPSRRALLRGAGLASVGVAAAAVATAAAATPAAATTGTMLYGDFNNAGAEATGLLATSASTTLEVLSQGRGSAIFAASGSEADRPTVQASSASIQPAVQGTGGSGPGVFGITSTNSAGVQGRTTGAGSAVYGLNANAASTAGVFGDANGTTKGVWGRHTGTNAAGIGVYGESAAGRGASFGGKAAQLRLRPSTAATRPGRGQRGDLFVDSTGRLWYCKGSTTWTRLA